MIKKVVAGVIACGVAVMSFAVDGTWTGTVNGAWSNTANWQGGSVASGTGFAAYLSNLPGPIQITNDVATLKLQGLVLQGGAYTVYGQPITFEGATAVPYGLIVSSGTHTVSSAINVNRNFHAMTEPGTTLTTSGRLDYLGSYQVLKKGGGEWAFAGWCAETNSAYNFDVVGGTFRLKPGSVFTKVGGNRENFRVGYSGLPGTAVVERAAMTIDGFVLGHDTAAAKGYLLVDGGALSATTMDEGNPILIGRYAVGMMALSNNATASIANWFNLGVYNRAEIFIGSGSSLSASRVSFGWKDTPNAAYQGPTVITIGDGSFTAVNQLFWRVGNLAARTNVVTVGDGVAGHGRLVVPATCQTTSEVGVARLVLNGGTLEMSGLKYTVNGETLTNYLFGLNQLWVGRAGATLNSGTNTLAIVQAVTRDPSVPRDGGISKTGTGTLTLAGGCAYNGPTAVIQGTLRFKGLLPTNGVTLAAGATLTLADGQYRALAPSSLTAGAEGESVIELEAGAGNLSDVLTLPADSQLGNVAFALVALNGVSSYWMPGDYVVATYAGAAPDVSGWHSVTPTGVTVTFEVQSAQKRVVMHVAGAASGSSVWLKPGVGSWSDAANWNTAPVNDPGTSVLFGAAPGGAASVGIGSAVTVGSMTFASAYPYTLSGAGITFGAAGSGGTLTVQQGAHAIGSALSLPTNLTVVAQPGALVTLGGGATGGGRVTVTGGGTLSITNGLAFDVPLTVNGAALGAIDSTTVDSALTVGASGATLAPSYGKTLTLSGTLDGPGSFVKNGAGIAVMNGANSCTGTLSIQNGTLKLTSLTAGGDFVIGEGTLKYVGPDVTTDKGFTIRTADPKKAAAFETDANVTFNGNIKTDSGVFIKAGKGTVTFAAPGTNMIGAGLGSDNYSIVLNRGAYGESPTQGLRIFQVLDGKVVLGVPGQTNIMNQTIVVGGRSTTAANAETAGHLEINDGFFQCGVITVGRGNGTATTAPTGLVSTLRMNGGLVHSQGLYLGLLLADMASGTCNARPRFEMNGGTFIGQQLLCGNAISPVTPRLFFNGGFAAFTNATAGDVRLAYDGGCTSETVIAGGTLAISNVVIRLADTNATAKGVLRLEGGRLITRGFERLGSGIGELYFNGGLMTLSQSTIMSNLSATVIQAGGWKAEVPQGLTLTLNQTMTHDTALGATADGGIVKLGAGSLTVNYPQTYTGPTVVSGGVFRLRNTLAVTNLTLSAGTTLSLTNGSNQLFAPSSFAVSDAAGSVRIEMDVAADGSAFDVLALPNASGAKLTLSLFKTGTATRFVSPGRYPLVTFGGAAPDTAEWSVENMGNTASFETEGATVYVRIGVSVTTPSVWSNAAGGDWGVAGNWSVAPASDETANVLFGSAISAPASINTGLGVTFGYMAVDNANAYSWNGGAMTLGSVDSNATVRVAQGSHTAGAALVAPSVATLWVEPGATLTVNGAVTGAGSLFVTGGGTLALTNGPAVDVPVTVNGATLVMPQSTEYDTALTLGAGGAVFAPAAGRTATVSSDITGSGGLTKTGSSFLTLAGGTDFDGELVVRNGTVSMAAEPDAPLVIGEGTFKYTGTGLTFLRGYTLRTTLNTQAATLYSDADITFNGQVKADNGAFIKLGSGTLTYAYAGENTLSAGDNIANGSTYLNVQPYGDTPTQGYRSYNVFNGKVILGAEGQTNRFSQAIIIGGQSTTNAEAETAGHMEINGGVNIFQDFITVGRGNGSVITAPTGLVSTLTVNGGETTASGFWMAAMQGFQTTLTARPLFTMNNGLLSTPVFYCGNTGGTPKPKIVINGGTLKVGPTDVMKLANSPGCETELTLSGGTVFVTNQPLSLAENYAGAKGTLNLDGGRLIAHNMTNGVNGAGLVYFNGGIFQPSASLTLSTVALTNRAGGAFFDVPQGVAYTLARTIGHDASLGASPDGGLTKLGAGTLLLSAVQAYTGPTVLSNGTLTVTAPVTNALSLAGLSLGGTVESDAQLTVTADRASFLAGGALAVSGDLFLGKAALNLIVRETGTAPTTNGTYVVATCSGTFSGSASDLRLANGLFGKSYVFSVVGTELRMTVATVTEDAILWSNPGSGEWLTSDNWVTAPGPGAAGMAIGFMDAITAPATVALETSATAGSMVFNNANSYTISSAAGTGALVFDETNGVPTLSALAGVHAVTVPASLVDNTTANIANGADLQMTGAVSGDGKLTKTGDGRLLLAGTNTYAGGTDVLRGTLDVSGANALSAGPVTFNGGHLAAKGVSGATVANGATVLQPMQIVTYAPLTVSGSWTSSGNIYLAKMSSNELAVAGAMKPAAGSANRLEFREGSVRFASGADALFTSTAARECINFMGAASTSVIRSMTVDPGATVSTRMLYMGYGATNTLSVNGGTLSLTGFSSTYYDAFIMGAAGTSPKVVDRFYVTGGTVYGADNAWCLMGVDRGKTTLDVSGGSVSLGAVSMGHRTEATIDTGLTAASDVFVSGGLLEARQRWNWMGDIQGPRVNAVYLNGGRLRLPATFAGVTNKINQSRLIFNGGLLETPGGGTDAEDPNDYLKGLKQAYVGGSGAMIDTLGRSVTLSQRLMTLDGVTDGGVTKLGLGTLALAKPPCVTGRVDVQCGTLRLLPEAATAYPDDPMLRVSFENGIQKDDSAYGRTVGLVGSPANLSLIGGVNGTNALHMGGQNVLYADYSSDMANADTFTVSAWVRQSAYQGVTQNRTFFGTLLGTQQSQEFLLRVEGGHFRMLGTGAANYGYGSFYADVLNAVPTNTWVMLTYVVDGLNGFSMYVNGERRNMQVLVNGTNAYGVVYGRDRQWLLQPPARTSGRGLMIGTVSQNDSTGFIGDLDDVTVYRRALSAIEIAMLYRAKDPCGKRVRVAMGAALDLSGGGHELAEVTGEGQINNGTAKVTGTLNPGDWPESPAGSLLSVANLTLGTNVTYTCNWTPAANDLVDIWGTLTVNGEGTIDLGLTTPSQMPGSPRYKSFPVMYYTSIVNAANFSQWKVIGIGRSAKASVSASGGVVTVNLDVPSGTLLRLK